MISVQSQRSLNRNRTKGLRSRQAQETLQGPTARLRFDFKSICENFPDTLHVPASPTLYRRMPAYL